MAILALAGTLGGSYLGVRAANKLVNFRIQALEEKVDKHNQVIERTFRLEERADIMAKDVGSLGEKIGGIAESVSGLARTCDVVKEQIKVANHRIADLEEEK